MAPASQTAPVTLRLTRTFAAAREAVFRAWTDPEAIKRWSASGDLTVAVAEVDLRVGGRYRIHMQAPDGTVNKVTGVYQLVDPPRRVAYTWSWENWPEAGETLVTVEFHDRGAQTELVLTHERFPNTEIRGRHEQGWTGALDKFGTIFPGA
jgi:uncharacterized protein YndB with AHSA1/START domain